MTDRCHSIERINITMFEIKENEQLINKYLTDPSTGTSFHLIRKQKKKKKMYSKKTDPSKEKNNW